MEQEKPQSEPRPAPARPLAAVAETVLALIAAIVLTLVLLVPVFAWTLVRELGDDLTPEQLLRATSRVEMELEPAVDGEPPRPLEEMLDLVSGLPDVQSVELLGPSGDERLVFWTPADVRLTIERVRAELGRHGLRSEDWETQKLYEAQRYLVRRETLRSMLPASITVQALAFVLAGGLMIRLRLRGQPVDGRVGPLMASLFGLAGGLVAFVLSTVVGFLFYVLGIPVTEQAWLVELLQDRGTLLALYPWIALVAPFSEEIFFRGYVFRFLAGRTGSIAGLVISSLMFALIHFNPSGILIYFGVGVVFALAYLRTRNLLAPIIAHGIYNSLVLGVTLIGPPV